jgi:UPF0755 protein
MKKRNSGRTVPVLLIAILAVVVVIASIVVYLGSPVEQTRRDVFFPVDKGASLQSITRSLSDASLVRSGDFAYLYARLARMNLKAGTYRLSPAQSTWSILRTLVEGKQEYHKVTIPEGLTLSKTARHLAAAGVISADAFITAARKTDVLANFGFPGKNAEGFLFPDTYFFPYSIDADSVVKMMVETFFRKLADVPNVPEKKTDFYAKVILASIVEREYRVDTEAPIIASVFANRLKIGMGLQSCATVEYIITELQGKPHPYRLYDSDIEVDNEYNTYKWAGLPPGPISNPGMVALNAAFNPADTSWLYFRLTDPEAGTHSFTHSLEEHIKAGKQNIVLKKAVGN